MKAGRELDALVAEHIMEWTSVKYLEETESFHGRSPNGEVLHVPNYSGDIAAAWELVEKKKMTVQCPGAIDNGGEYRNDTDGWIVECEDFEKNAVWIEAEAAPLAICLAALEAKGVEVPA